MCKKVLLISYYWHPALGPAVQRWSLFLEELKKAGITPYVLTVKDGTYPAFDPEYNQDEESSRIIRTATREPFGIYNWLRGKKKSSAVGMGDVSSNLSWDSTPFYSIFSHEILPMNCTIVQSYLVLLKQTCTPEIHDLIPQKYTVYYTGDLEKLCGFAELYNL
jgi:hypothetical protein